MLEIIHSIKLKKVFRKNIVSETANLFPFFPLLASYPIEFKVDLVPRRDTAVCTGKSDHVFKMGEKSLFIYPQSCQYPISIVSLWNNINSASKKKKKKRKGKFSLQEEIY